MSITLRPLSDNDTYSYEAFVTSEDHSLMYYSLTYRDFLKKILQQSEDKYIIALSDERIVGVLPAFLKRHPRYGNVLNSLPFYGSNGGPLVSSTSADPDRIRKLLLEEFYRTAQEEDVIASTVISNPLDPDTRFLAEKSRYTFQDKRLGQITFLPITEESKNSVAESLMALYHYKTRNAIRKAQKSGVKVGHSNSEDIFRQLAALHKENITALGGLAKPWNVFSAIRNSFTYDRDYRIYFAEIAGSVVALLLVFYFNKTAEYHTPVTMPEYRINQPMSLLILEAMCEAVRRGCKYWNWGGTWLSQEGIYRFKSKWGTQDFLYYYYTRLFRSEIELRHLTKEDLLREYSSYYVLPFSELSA